MYLHGVGEVEQDDDLILSDVISFKLRVECQHARLQGEEAG